MEQTAAYLAQAHGLLPQNTELIDTSTYYDVGPQDFYTIYNELHYSRRQALSTARGRL